MTIWKRSRALALFGFLLILATFALAAEPTYLAEMPTPDEVIAKTTRQDPFDTSARQYVTFDRLFSMMLELMGDRYLRGEMTSAEKAVRDAYNSNRGRVLRELKESLPPDQREFQPNTRFTEWRALVVRYEADPKFNEQLLATFFSPTFLVSYAKAHAATRPPPSPGSRTPAAPGSASSPPSPSGRRGSAPSATLVFVAAMLVVAVVTRVLLRGRLELDAKDAFRLYLGLREFKLSHVTGSVEGVTKMATTNVHGGGGGGYIAPGTGGGYGGGGYIAPVSISSTTTIHDQFFIRTRDGRVEPVQLAGWDVPIAEGHILSVVTMIRVGSGSGNHFFLHNHTTKLRYFSTSFLEAGLRGGTGMLVAALDVVLCVLLVHFAPPAVSRFAVIGGTVAGAMVGSLLWRKKMQGLIPCFKTDGLRRFYTVLDAAALTAAVP